MAHCKPYTADEDRMILAMYNNGKTFNQIGFRMGRSADGVQKRYQRLVNDGIDSGFYEKLHRLAIGFRE